MTALLETTGLTAFYGDFQALFGVDIRVEAGETIAIIGANGAGKTTLMRAISGVLKSAADTITCRGEAIGAIGMTEPSAGSDLASIRTHAVRSGDDWQGTAPQRRTGWRRPVHRGSRCGSG